MSFSRLTKAVFSTALAFSLFNTSLPIAFAQTTETKMPAGIERGAAVEGITEYRLPNGLRVLLFPDQTKQTTTVNMTYLVGSRHENYGENGKKRRD